MPKLTFITKGGGQIEVVARSGGSLMEAAVANLVAGIDADCGGGCTCATCHIYIDSKWVSRVGAANELEAQILEFDDLSRENSRLSCQVEMTDELDGLVVTVAKP
jgi:2Fe-2S ferredoxin